MAKVLVVRAHPLKEDVSRSMRVQMNCSAYKQENPDDEIRDINLYDMNIPEIDKIIIAWNDLSGKPFYSLTNSGNISDFIAH